MIAPAMLGPTRRAALNIDEFRAMALPRSRLSSMSSTTNAWRTGRSKALTMPEQTLTMISQRMEMVLDRVRAASTNEMSIDATCVPTSKRWRFQRST